MSVKVAQVATPLFTSRKWTLPWHWYLGLLRFSALADPAPPDATIPPGRVSGDDRASGARAGAAPAAWGTVDCFKAARYAAPAPVSSSIATDSLYPRGETPG